MSSDSSDDVFWEIVRPVGPEFRQLELNALYDSLEQRMSLPPLLKPRTSTGEWRDAIRWFWERRPQEGDDREDI